MPAPQIDIQKVATLARLKLTDEELEHYSTQLNQILAYMAVLAAHDLSEAEPTAHAMPIYDVLRKDEARPGLTLDQALSNAPRRIGDQFQIPKVVE